MSSVLSEKYILLSGSIHTIFIAQYFFYLPACSPACESGQSVLWIINMKSQYFNENLRCYSNKKNRRFCCNMDVFQQFFMSQKLERCSLKTYSKVWVISTSSQGWVICYTGSWFCGCPITSISRLSFGFYWKKYVQQWSMSVEIWGQIPFIQLPQYVYLPGVPKPAIRVTSLSVFKIHFWCHPLF